MAAKPFNCWGIHAVQSALAKAPECALEVWLKAGSGSQELDAIREAALALGVTVNEAPVKTLERMSAGAVHQGVILRRRLPVFMPLGEYLAALLGRDDPALLLVLDQVQDPQNFGACLRVADGAGVDAVVVPRDHCAAISGTVAKAASGALDTVPLINVPNLARALDELRSAGVWAVGAAHESESSLYTCDFRLPLAVVFGSEGSGLRHLTRKKCDQTFSIPMHGQISSLNVSTAVAIALFEATRQRGASLG